MQVGWLRLVEYCSETACSRNFFFEPESGDVIKLTDPSDCPINTRVAADIQDAAIVYWELA